ncbi:MAG: hypothetical protein HQL07_16260 [Nitrospirae bacterium]|nr:hypothetical protein [Magnetococcales bacterium]
MALQPIELEQITSHVSQQIKTHWAEWFSDKIPGQPLAMYEIEIRERIVRVEEELRHQRELMQQGFSLMDKRFVEMREDMNKRFEAVDKRFEAMDKRFVEMREDMNKRFEAVDKHFEAVDKRFEAVDKRFEAVDKHFEQMERRMDASFDALTRRMDRFMIWSFGMTVAATGTVISVLKLFP